MVAVACYEGDGEVLLVNGFVWESQYICFQGDIFVARKVKTEVLFQL